MSIVLWANTLIDGELNSDELDKYALYKYSKKLDKLTTKLEVSSFISAQDFTDMQFNVSGDDLPDGMQSTDELMANNGVWISGKEAVVMLETLISHISSNNIKFGLLRNDAKDILGELKESLEVAKLAKNANGMFNFSVVM